MSEAVQRLLVAYDIRDDARRDRVAVILQGYGERVQYSVFVVDGRPAQFVRLRASLATVIDSGCDSVMLCHIGPRETAARKTEYLGARRSLTGDDPALIL